jgi:hypothetical protein
MIAFIFLIKQIVKHSKKVNDDNNLNMNEVIISNYIEMTHYKYLNAILFTYNLPTSSSNQYMIHQ